MRSSFPVILSHILITVQAILDTCHSGTLLDLPHHHCNSVYVPWQSKGTRRTLTMQNNNGLHSHSTIVRWADIHLVRRQATDFTKSRSPDQPLPPIATIMDLQEPGDRSARPPSRIDDGASEGRSVVQRESSPAAKSRATRRPRERSLFPSQPRSASPESLFICSGWCDHDDNPYPTVVSLTYSICLVSGWWSHVSRQLSLSACSDLQRAWEGPNGSLTTVVCNYLSSCIQQAVV